MTSLTQQSSTLIQPLPESWIEKLFDKLLLDYGKKFTDQWGGADPDKMVAHWALELAEFSKSELKRGYDALDSRDWPPSLPEFKRMCRPAIDATVAYYEAIAGLIARDKGEQGEWSHAGIFWAASKMSFDLRNQTYSTVRARWEKTLQDEMDKGEWSAIPAPLKALPAPEISREKAARVLQELGAAKVLAPKTDYLRWAKRILEREKRGDRTLSALQVRMATEAMAAGSH